MAPGRIGAGTGAGETGAIGCKEQCTAKLVCADILQLLSGKTFLLVQGEQQRRLKTVARADGVGDHDFGRATSICPAPACHALAPLLPRVMTTRLAPPA